jgi:death-on-curing protein
MKYITLGEVIDLYFQIMNKTGSLPGIRDLGLLESAIAQPRMTFGDKDLYPTIEEKAAALGYSILMNYPFVDGNKRIGHAAMEVFLVMNGKEIKAVIDEQEKIILHLAANRIDRQVFTDWICSHINEKCA